MLSKEQTLIISYSEANITFDLSSKDSRVSNIFHSQNRSKVSALMYVYFLIS